MCLPSIDRRWKSALLSGGQHSSSDLLTYERKTCQKASNSKGLTFSITFIASSAEDFYSVTHFSSTSPFRQHVPVSSFQPICFLSSNSESFHRRDIIGFSPITLTGRRQCGLFLCLFILASRKRGRVFHHRHLMYRLHAVPHPCGVPLLIYLFSSAVP